MIDSLAALAAAASTALVGAMATDVWGTARDGMLRVLGRGEPLGEEEPSALAAQLDGEAALVRAADDAEAARQSLVPAWRLRLEQFLRDNPEAVDDVRALTRRLSAELPHTPQYSVQHVVAHDNAQAFGVQHGNVIIHQEPGAQAADRGDPAP